MALLTVNSAEALKALAGSELGVSEWLEVTQERISQFADATGDHQWIHVDPARATAESPYQATIAHGFLTLSLVSQFIREAVEFAGLRMAINYGLNKVRFPAAVRSGSRVRARIALLSVKDVADGNESVYLITVENEGSDKPCCVAEWVVRYYWA